MIYSKFGCELELVAYCGKHAPKGHPLPLMLIKAKYKDRLPSDAEFVFKFAHTLKADGGFGEIHDVIDALPVIVLQGAELKAALKDAE